jgi:hypothetical protein
LSPASNGALSIESRHSLRKLAMAEFVVMAFTAADFAGDILHAVPE